MSYRTNEGNVADVLGVNYDGKTNLRPFIDAANELTTQVAALALQNKNLILSATLLEKIERYISCHLYGFQDQFYQSKNTGRSGASFQGQTGMGLDSTQYGQMAKLLDTSRTLAALDKGGFAGLNWLGTPLANDQSVEQSEQTQESP